MTQQLLQVLLGIVMYSLMGLLVGIGITIAEEFPKVGEFLKRRPIVGWPIAFALGYAVHSVLMYLFEVAIIAILAAVLR
jgi:hypothetical protein